MSPSSPIAIIDSTLGGLTVVRALHQLLRGEDIVFLADTARGPYASKSAETIGEYTSELVDHLRVFSPKHIAIACHCAAAALPAIKAQFGGLSISGIIDATARGAVDQAGSRQTPVIGIVAPEAAIRSKAYDRAIHRRRHHAHLLLRPTPLLDAIAEEGRPMDDAVLGVALSRYLDPIVERGANLIVLASSWYSTLRLAVARAIPDGIGLVDSADCCAQDVARRLQAAGLLRGGSPSGAIHCLLTDQTPRFDSHARRLLGRAIDPPKLIPLHDMMQPPRSLPDVRVA